MYAELALDAKPSHRPLGDQLCQEFMALLLQFILRAAPPFAGMMYSALSGCSSMKFLALQNTSHFPSGEYLGKKLLMPLPDAPGSGSALPPRPPLKGTL